MLFWISETDGKQIEKASLFYRLLALLLLALPAPRRDDSPRPAPRLALDGDCHLAQHPGHEIPHDARLLPPLLWLRRRLLDGGLPSGPEQQPDRAGRLSGVELKVQLFPVSLCQQSTCTNVAAKTQKRSRTVPLDVLGINRRIHDRCLPGQPLRQLRLGEHMPHW